MPLCASSATPASSDPPTAALTRYLDRLYFDRANAYRRKLRSCRRGLSRRAVHQLRVAIRQLLATFDLLRTVQEDLPAVTGPLRKQLRALGDLRNAQLQHKRVARGSNSALQSLCQYLLKRERRREEGVAEVIASHQVTHRLKRWRMKTASPRSKSAWRLRRLLEGRLRRAFDPLAAFAPSSPIDPLQRHQTRGELREFRYLLKSLPSAWRRGAAITQLLSHLHGYQRTTGKIHDDELLLRRLDRLLADQRLKAVSVRSLRRRLLSERAQRLKSCPVSERQLFHEAILARRALLKNLP